MWLGVIFRVCEEDDTGEFGGLGGSGQLPRFKALMAELRIACFDLDWGFACGDKMGFCRGGLPCGGVFGSRKS